MAAVRQELVRRDWKCRKACWNCPGLLVPHAGVVEEPALGEGRPRGVPRGRQAGRRLRGCRRPGQAWRRWTAPRGRFEPEDERGGRERDAVVGREPKPVFLLRLLVQLVGRCCSFALILFCWRSLDIQNFENSRLKTSSLHSTRPALAHLSARFSQSASPLSILIVDLETGLAESSLRCVANTTPSSCKGVKSTRELNKEKVKIGVFGLSDPHFPVSPSLRGCRPEST